MFKLMNKKIIIFLCRNKFAYLDQCYVLFYRKEFAAAWMNLGIVKASLKKPAEAERCYFTAMKHRRKYPDCLYNLGNLVSI